MSGVSLWLSPPPGPHPLRNLLRDLSSQHQTPQFDPHLTLLSDHLCPSFPGPSPDGLDEDRYAACVRAGLADWRRRGHGPSPRIRFLDVRRGEAYYQSVLAAVHRDAQLWELHRAMCAAFGVDPRKADGYFPHVSLVYGDDEADEADPGKPAVTAEVRERIIADLVAGGQVVQPGSREDPAARCTIAGEEEYVPTEVVIVYTKEKDTSKWKVIGRVPFAPQEQGWVDSLLGWCTVM